MFREAIQAHPDKVGRAPRENRPSPSRNSSVKYTMFSCQTELSFPYSLVLGLKNRERCPVSSSATSEESCGLGVGVKTGGICRNNQKKISTNEIGHYDYMVPRVAEQHPRRGAKVLCGFRELDETYGSETLRCPGSSVIFKSQSIVCFRSISITFPRNYPTPRAETQFLCDQQRDPRLFLRFYSISSAPVLKMNFL